MNTKPMNHILYINNVLHHATGIEGVIFVDHPSMPYRYCAQHRLPLHAATHLQTQRIYTSGNWYSLRPDRIDPLPEPTPLPTLQMQPTMPAPLTPRERQYVALRYRLAVVLVVLSIVMWVTR